ncbi:hypothetical protein GCM10008955_10220 [Deinococcus malanensis]|uniref:Uncharacterized protein n=1 Tax=Deinococcus malanensis TaxID=1706855 RepID=A0ABQ2EP46_9DEIO|nr:hypothetical protein GCM10008955_10220 [Deinococcus malanensis]
MPLYRPAPSRKELQIEWDGNPVCTHLSVKDGLGPGRGGFSAPALVASRRNLPYLFISKMNGVALYPSRKKRADPSVRLPQFGWLTHSDPKETLDGETISDFTIGT